MFTSGPIALGARCLSRVAVGEPISTSVCPDTFAITRCNALSSTMNGVARSDEASSDTRRGIAASNDTGTLPDRNRGRAGRDRSVGSASDGAPDRFSRQYERSESATAEVFSGSGSGSGSTPPEYTVDSSARKTPSDHPSQTRWCAAT
jgi:hypothetical protein